MVKARLQGDYYYDEYDEYNATSSKNAKEI